MKRRRVLAALGATGLAAFAGLGIATDDAVRYTYASSHECDGATLTAEWRETYTSDGQTTLLENTTADAGAGEDTGTEDTADEPAIINLQDVLPGDRGTVSVRITAESLDDGVDSVTPTLDLVLDEAAENDLIDPEREADDTSDTMGELQNFLDVKLWKDEGLLGVDVLGADNIEDDIGEDTIDEGTLDGVAGRVNNEPLGTIGEGEDVSIAFRWGFSDVGDINVTQSDSVTFTFDIGCD